MAAPGRTQVHLTVDVECAEERIVSGRVIPAHGYDARMRGQFINHKEALGTPFLCQTLSMHGFSGTFFVEPLSSLHFGADGLHRVCRDLVAEGQDVQLHLHPVLRTPDLITRRLARPNDDIGSYDLATQTALVREAKTLLAAHGGVAENTIVAFRAGNFGADNRTFEALAAANISIDSSYNPSFTVPADGEGCHIEIVDAPTDLFATEVATVRELPITCAKAPSGALRHLQLSALSSQEMRHALLHAARLGLKNVTILTHPFEYFWASDDGRRGRKNHVNRRRLQRLVRFLREREDLFEVVPLGALAGRLVDRPLESPSRAYPASQPYHRFRRWVGQAAMRLAGRLPLR